MARERSRRLTKIVSNGPSGPVERTATVVEVLDDDGVARTVYLEGDRLAEQGKPASATAILPLIPRTIPVNNAPDRLDFDDYQHPAYMRWARWKAAREEAVFRKEVKAIIDLCKAKEDAAWARFTTILQDATMRRPNQRA